MNTVDRRPDAAATRTNGSFFHVASWNVNGQRGNVVDSHIRFLQAKGCSVVALQEVRQDYFAALQRHPGVVSSAYSLAVRPPAANAPAKRRLGCALMSLDASVHFRNAALIETSICPERALVAETSVGDHRLLAASLHCPNGSNWGHDKALWFHEVSQWVSAQTMPTIFGIDANTPKNERLADTNPGKWWREDSHPTIGNGARQLVGDAPSHELRDVWKRLHPTAMNYPISHNRGRGGAKRPEFECRYDFIFASPHFTPIACTYHYQDVVTAIPRMSDHALVTATVQL